LAWLTASFSRVGASDDLSRGRSTFMVEMIETAAILNQATPRLDRHPRRGRPRHVDLGRSRHRLGGGRASARGQQVPRFVRDPLSRAYGAGDTLKACANASLRAQEWGGDLVFLHEVKPGPADRSYGVQVAKLAGLPALAVRRAEAVLKKLEAKEGGARRLEELPLFAAFAPAPVEPREPSQADKLLGRTRPRFPDAKAKPSSSSTGSRRRPAHQRNNFAEFATSMVKYATRSGESCSIASEAMGSLNVKKTQQIQ
jgi:DNA mismatch repair protein MutS